MTEQEKQNDVKTKYGYIPSEIMELRNSAKIEAQQLMTSYSYSGDLSDLV